VSWPQNSLQAHYPSEKHVLSDKLLGAGGFVAVGVIGLIAGGVYLQNVVPLGPVGTVYSAGTIPLINLAVGLEVGSGFLLMLSEFLAQTLRIRARRGR